MKQSKQLAIFVSLPTIQKIPIAHLEKTIKNNNYFDNYVSVVTIMGLTIISTFLHDFVGFDV